MTATKTKGTKKAPKAASKPQAKAAKPKRTAPKATPPAPAKKTKSSALDAAARVLTETGGSMTTKELIEAMAAQKLWSSPNGKTPAATLYAAILREVATKGSASRFQKTEPGKFAATTAGGTTAPKPKAPKAAKPKGVKKAKSTEPAAPMIPDGTPGPESLSELFRI